MIDTILRGFFNQYLQSFFEPLNHGSLQLSYENGITLKNLRVKPDQINDILESGSIDLRILSGVVGQLQILYTGLTGQLTIQFKDVMVELQPHAIKTVGKVIVNSIANLMQPSLPTEELSKNKIYLNPTPISPYRFPQYYVSSPESDKGSFTNCLAYNSKKKKNKRLYIPLYQPMYCKSGPMHCKFGSVHCNFAHMHCNPGPLHCNHCNHLANSKKENWQGLSINCDNIINSTYHNCSDKNNQTVQNELHHIPSQIRPPKIKYYDSRIDLNF